MLCQFVKISTHSISLPSFIIICLEITKLGGHIGPPSPFQVGKKSSPNRVITEFYIGDAVYISNT